MDRLIQRFPQHNFTKINVDNTLVTHPTWEKAIIKLQNSIEDMLTAAEKRKVKRYYIDVEAAVNADDDESGDDNDDDDFNVMEILDAQEKEVSARSNIYSNNVI